MSIKPLIFLKKENAILGLMTYFVNISLFKVSKLFKKLNVLSYMKNFLEILVLLHFYSIFLDKNDWNYFNYFFAVESINYNCNM